MELISRDSFWSVVQILVGELKERKFTFLPVNVDHLAQDFSLSVPVESFPYFNILINPIALRKTKILWNFDCSECNRVDIRSQMCHDVHKALKHA